MLCYHGEKITKHTPDGLKLFVIVTGNYRVNILLSSRKRALFKKCRKYAIVTIQSNFQSFHKTLTINTPKHVQRLPNYITHHAEQ